MSLESEIRTRWTSKSTLAALLDVENLTTGSTTSHALPYAIMQRVSSRQTLSTGNSDVEEIDLLFEIYHEDYTAAASIRDTLTAVSPTGFHNEAFTMDANNIVLSMKKQSQRTRKDTETGVWIFEVHFTILLQKR